VNSSQWFKTLKHARSCPNELHANEDDASENTTNTGLEHNTAVEHSNRRSSAAVKHGHVSPPMSPFVPIGTVKRQVESININSKPIIEFENDDGDDSAVDDDDVDDDDDDVKSNESKETDVEDQGVEDALMQQRSPDSKRFKCEEVSVRDEEELADLDDDDVNNNTNGKSPLVDWTQDDQVVSSQENSACSSKSGVGEDGSKQQFEVTADDNGDEECLNSSLSRANQFYRSKKLFEQLEDMQNGQYQQQQQQRGSSRAVKGSKNKLSEVDLVKKPTKMSEIR
jgi:hypothetical protein